MKTGDRHQECEGYSKETKHRRVGMVVKWGDKKNRLFKCPICGRAYMRRLGQRNRAYWSP